MSRHLNLNLAQKEKVRRNSRKLELRKQESKRDMSRVFWMELPGDLVRCVGLGLETEVMFFILTIIYQTQQTTISSSQKKQFWDDLKLNKRSKTNKVGHKREKKRIDSQIQSLLKLERRDERDNQILEKR